MTAAADAQASAAPSAAGRWTRSLRLRLLLATLAAAAVAMLLAGAGLSALFRDHARRQVELTMTTQLDQLTARLEFDTAAQPAIDPAALSDPRWSRPYSGLYWQLDAVADGAPQRGVLRSRSLWDAVLEVPRDALADGAVHAHEATGPGGARVLVLERTVRAGEGGGSAWRLVVAADLHELQDATARFTGALTASLAVLLVLLGAAAVAQVGVGLAPLRALQRSVVEVHEGRVSRLAGRFPSEVQPLVDDFNRVLDRNAEIVARARHQAGNLAHAVKTPLATLRQAAAAAAQRRGGAAELPTLVQQQVDVAQRHVDWHLARARAAAAQGLPGARVAVAPVIDALVRVMHKVHGERDLQIVVEPSGQACDFAGEAQDLQEVLGNVLDNACKWARHEVRVAARRHETPQGMRLCVTVEDDGPGIAPELRESVLARGARLDESVPGSGLGLAIVRELVDLYGGTLALSAAPGAGLRVELDLPATA
jgi:signal transduction histidine kinase